MESKANTIQISSEFSSFNWDISSPGCPGGAGHGVQVDGVADGQIPLPGEAEDGQHRDVECPDTDQQKDKTR